MAVYSSSRSSMIMGNVHGATSSSECSSAHVLSSSYARDDSSAAVRPNLMRPPLSGPITPSTVPMLTSASSASRVRRAAASLSS